ncbi:MAG TPA: hypothetical protein ENF30_02005 [Candidatus Desulfofervidus auxilii]|uniref:Type I restriction enzyme R protein N-terminal domain-containing protein n=1 Tax=Desulfofervidus auxilii TaxID=1621989 RepID=A0A7V0IA72_DESA2|nr:hypothetical protein [Candidatus Desulfofervidus auxilii]
MPEIVDFFTGKKMPDTDMERLRQRVGRFLVEKKGYNKSDIERDVIFEVFVNEKKIVIPIDYIVCLDNKRVILIKCFPTALITREKITLACARLLNNNYIIPLTVITDGFATEVLDTYSGKVIAEDLDKIPTKDELYKMMPKLRFEPIPEQRKEKEKKILAAFDVWKCPISCKECSLSS